MTVRGVMQELRDMALSFGIVAPLVLTGMILVVGVLAGMSSLSLSLISLGLTLISGGCARVTHRLRVQPYQAHIALLQGQNARLADAVLQLAEGQPVNVEWNGEGVIVIK